VDWKHRTDRVARVGPECFRRWFGIVEKSKLVALPIAWLGGVYRERKNKKETWRWFSVFIFKKNVLPHRTSEKQEQSTVPNFFKFS